MAFLLDKCTLKVYDSTIISACCSNFDCGNDDLNDFENLFSTEEQEKEFTGLDSNAILKTRLLYFDLIVLHN